MHTRLRLLKGATALLYFGPLLAGLGGFGWAVVPLFAAIFMVWLFVLRPQQWPRNMADWGQPEALISLLTQGVVQVLLVTVSFGIGRGIGGVLGAVPPFPLMLPVAVSFLAIPLARMLWDPWQADTAGELLDEAIARAAEQADDPAPPVEDLHTRVEMAGRMLDSLPASYALDNPAENPGSRPGSRLGDPTDKTPGKILASHLMAMSAHVGHDALRVALMDRIYDRSASLLHQQAAVVHATEGAAVDALAGASYPMALFRELTAPDLLRLFANRCAALIADDPARLTDCPDPDAVLAMAGQVPPAAEALRALAAAMARAPGTPT